MVDQFHPLDNDVVIKVEEKLNSNLFELIHNKSSTFDVQELYNAALEGIKRSRTPDEYRLFTEGIESKVIGFQGGNWKKGKIKCKFVLEFSPDEPIINQVPSPLDEFRQ